MNRYKVIKHKKSNRYVHFSVQPSNINLSDVPVLYPLSTKVDNLKFLFLDHEINWDWNNFVESEVDVLPVTPGKVDFFEN